jgi:hypothetical protein
MMSQFHPRGIEGNRPPSFRLFHDFPAGTKINCASGSTNFLISQGQATRFTFTPSLVIHFISILPFREPTIPTETRDYFIPYIVGWEFTK